MATWSHLLRFTNEIFVVAFFFLSFLFFFFFFPFLSIIANTFTYPIPKQENFFPLSTPAVFSDEKTGRVF